MTSITANKVATIHYILTDEAGETLDSSRDGDPMPYLHGAGNIVPGLETQLEGKAVGDKIKAVVAPEDGYGPKSGMPPQAVPKAAFEGVEPQPGMPLVVEDDEGNHMQLWVAAVAEDQVLITPDHPLAGVTLHFDVEIMEVRDATETELEHGHAHSGDGHHH
jgi:FKBP-type peptidyl-prolyl cis-trans isomerase SlyD